MVWMNPRVAGINLSHIRTVMERSAQLEQEGRPIVHMELGEPDFPTPDPLVEAAVSALRQGYTHYGPDEGVVKLREYVAGKLNREKGLNLNPYENVIITSGASEDIFASLVGLTGPGCSVLIPEPGFGNYYNCCLCAGSRPVTVPLKLAATCELDFNALEAALDESSAFIVLNNPHNPTGGVFPARDIERLAALAIEKDLVVITDEIYEDMYYGEKPLSIASVEGMAERTVLIGGFSKSYAMTGWRIGYVAAPLPLYEPIQKIHQYVVTCVSTFSQVAIASAIRNCQEEQGRMLEELKRRRAYLVSRCRRIRGLSYIEPQGAFYLFVNITAAGLTSMEFATRLLEERGLAMVPGSIFGPSGEGYIRLSYASSLEDIIKGADILEEFFREHAG